MFRRVFGWLGWGSLCGFLACSASEGKSPEGGEGFGGASTSAGASGAPEVGGGTGIGAGGAASLDPATTSRYGACAAYVRAQCERRYVGCGYVGPDGPSEHLERCLDAQNRCPDALMSEGSNWTNASLLSCALEWEQLPCEDLRAGRPPACTGPAGNLADGSPCYHPSQCAGRACVSDPDSSLSGCGSCATGLESGQACTTHGECLYGMTCTDGVCTVTTFAELGEACGTSACLLGLDCRADASGVSVCSVPGAVGESCTGSCAGDAYCDAGLCVADPQLGEPCINAICIEDALCNSTTGICEAQAPLDGACASGASGLVGNCRDGQLCVCADDACSSGGTCRSRGLEGEPCDVSRPLCTPGTECTDGSCQGVELQGFYAAACGP